MNQIKKRYTVDINWQLLFADLDVSTQDVLRHAHLPFDLFSRKTPTLTGDEFFRLWQGLSYVTRQEPTFPLRLGTSVSVETFSPAIFACMCSSNLNVALQRIAQYKPLVGPLELNVRVETRYTSVVLSGLPEQSPATAALMAAELVFWVHVARLATREHMIPLAVHFAFNLLQKEAYESFFGVQIVSSSFNGLTFAAEDAQKPFLTVNEKMWSIFKPELNAQIKELHPGSSFQDRVRAVLMEVIASGEYSKSDIASRLAVSPRTLQRLLEEEGTTYQKVLDKLREELALNYLNNTDYTSGQIAFLVGFNNPNSFFRAFRSWTGQTPDSIRAVAP